MKFSCFNIWSHRNRGLILFNSSTGALVLFDDERKGLMLEALTTNNPGVVSHEFVSDLLEDGFLVNKSKDELETIREARQERLSREDEYSLCVILNMQCNFSCIYCFEKHTGESLPTDEESKIRMMLKEVVGKARKVDVDWFGGEPLLSFKALVEMNDYLMDITRKGGVEYHHSLTTNGSCLSKEVIEYLAKTPLSQAVITLDGPPDLHDQSRPLKSGGPTFWKIIRNVKMAVTAGLNIHIRVNATRRNIERIPELYSILEGEGLKNKVRVNIQGVVSSSANPCDDNCLSGYELAHQVLSIYRKMAEEGWIVFPSMESIRALGFCVGEYPHRYITDLHGSLCRCSQMLGTSSLGMIRGDGSLSLDHDINERWTQKDPLDFPECRQCPFLPLCMGGCNMKRERGLDYCLDWSYDKNLFLEVLVQNEENLGH